MTVLFESKELGPVAVGDGFVYVAEADPSLPRKSPVGELFDPSARFWIVEVELATGTRRVLRQLVPRPFAIARRGSFLTIAGGGLRAAVVPVGPMMPFRADPHPDKGIAIGKRYSVFADDRDVLQ